MKKEQIAAELERLYQHPVRITWIQNDPIAFPHRYSDPKDIEVVGWLASALAYGGINLFKPVIEKILALMGAHPHDYLDTFDPVRERPRFEGISYRFNKSDDLFTFVLLMSRVVRQFGSVGRGFTRLYRHEEADLQPTLSRFVANLYEMAPPDGLSRGLSHLLPRPERGSECKRWNLYLRWMIRPNDGVDFGLWRDIPPQKLVIPLDTHLTHISRYLGLTRRKGRDWKTAREVTERLKQFDPHDPVKYDFVLCHLDITRACPLEHPTSLCLFAPLYKNPDIQ
jgi:uncharacterized protein (TIGR02757 family)